MMRFVIGIIWLSSCSFGIAQDTPKLSKQTLEKLRACTSELATAQKAEQETKIKEITQKARELLGDQAGLPEVADEFRSLPKEAKPLTKEELSTAFDPYIPFIERQKWWKINLDPTKTNHALRELATIIEGCLSASTLRESQAKSLQQIAQEAGEFLIWAQDQAETGVIPFPAIRNGTGRPFEVAERFYRQAERAGKLDQIIRHGWAIEDFEDGGLQFDNGLCGVALVRLFEFTNDDKFKKAAIRSADWARQRQVVTNWNYNSFSVYLLAEVYRITGEKRYLDAAKKKTRLGILPGQLTDGPRKGRWADAHNARPAYHYILVRGLASLAAVLPKEDPDLPIILESLRLALQARNPDFKKGIINADSAVEALVRVQTLPPHVVDKLSDCETAETLQILERYAATGFRTKRFALSPGAWGQLLAFRNKAWK